EVAVDTELLRRRLSVAEPTPVEPDEAWLGGKPSEGPRYAAARERRVRRTGEVVGNAAGRGA
ncbi:MAG TPA: hypothetical protein VGD71_42840, partial [Kribbella sp.]